MVTLPKDSPDALSHDELTEMVLEGVDRVTDEYDVRPISVRLRGSYERGTASETSDVDFGMVFVQDPIDYICPSEYTESIDRSYTVDGHEVDVIGWDIRYFGELVRRSDPTVIEVMHGFSIVSNELRINTIETEMNMLRASVKKNFDRAGLYHHYISMARNNYEKYIVSENEQTVKKNVNIIRACLSAWYIRNRDELPPRDVFKLTDRVCRYGGKEYVELTEFRELLQMKLDGESHEEVGDKSKPIIEAIAHETGRDNEWPKFHGSGNGDTEAVSHNLRVFSQNVLDEGVLN